MKTLLILIVSFCFSAEWGTSFSVRTPNDDSQPLDYEIALKLQDDSGKLIYSIKRDWERELGKKYIDDVLHIQHQVLGHLYYGFDYVNKESKDIDYITYNIGASIDWFKAGIALKQVDEKISPLLNIAFYTKLKKDDLEYLFSLSTKSDITETHIVNLKSEIKKWLTKKINVFGLYKHEYYNEKEDFQFKIGLGIKI